jgi:xanthine dehydrogenase YagS FAD-binding subunit
MLPFQYVRPADAEAAVSALSVPGAVPLGGGTDLLPTVREGLVAPVALVDLVRLPESGTVAPTPDGGLRIGAGVRLAQLAAHPEVRARWPLLADACAAVGSEALRTTGTLGGNLCQRPRCWYWRQGVACRKAGGDACPAEHGEHQYHAVLDGGPCWAVHPSDPAVALTALEATVVLRGSDGERALPIAEFYVLPSERVDAETVLAQGEYVAAVELPATSAGGTQRYAKLLQRGAWDFALVSLAAAKRADGDVRLVLGGVAPRPWRVNWSIEEDVASGGLDDDGIDALAERALYDARPLARNGYKVAQARALLRRAMRELDPR